MDFSKPSREPLRALDICTQIFFLCGFLIFSEWTKGNCKSATKIICNFLLIDTFRNYKEIMGETIFRKI